MPGPDEGPRLSSLRVAHLVRAKNTLVPAIAACWYAPMTGMGRKRTMQLRRAGQMDSKIHVTGRFR